MSTNLDAALAYAARGWRVAPIPPGRKHPAIASWQTAATTDEATIRTWWGATPDHGVCIATGATSGVWVLDVDVADGKAGDETLAELEAAYGPLPATYEVITGSGGRHLYFAWPTGGQVIRNSASGALGADLDVRGEGGQVVAPPTIHPNGTAYAHELGSPEEVAEAPGWLLALLDDVDEASAPRTPLATDSDRPGDLWAAQTAWDELLVPDGWTKARPGPAGEDRWVRPGKDARDGISATVGYGGSDVLKVFTSSHPHLRAEATYTKLGYLAAVRFDGDHSAAARWLRSQGHHAPAPDHEAIGLADVARSSANSTPTSANEAPAGTGNPELGAPWDEPIPLVDGGEYPQVPIDAMPDWMANQVRNVANQLDCDPMLPFVFGLGALSVASLGHVRLAMRAGQTMDSTGLYLIAAGPKAAGKSPALKMMFGPVYDHQAQRIAACASAVAEAASAKRIAQRKLKEAEERASRLDDELEHATEAKRLALEVEEIKVPPTGEMITTDITPERLATVMAENNERMAIVSDEAGILTVDRYANRGVAKKVDIYLQSFTGEPVAVHRQGAPTIRLERPLLAIVTGAQPHAVHHALNDPELRERGFSDRFLTASTNVLAGNVDIDHDVWDHEAASAYEERLRALANQWGSWGRPATVTLSPEARSRYSSWSRETLAMSAEPGLDGQDGWLSKARQSVARIATLLHLAEGHAYDVEVARETIDRAIEIGEWFIAHHAREVELPGTEMAAKLLDALVRIATKSDGPAGCRATDLEKGPFVARRELGRSAPVGLRKIDDFTPPLEVLAERGLVRLVGVTGSPNAHFSDQVRRAAGIQVHPSAIARDSPRHARQRVGFSPVEDNESAREREGVGEITVSRIRDRDDPLSPWSSVDNSAPGPVPSSTPRDSRDSATASEPRVISIPASGWDLFAPEEDAG